MILIMKYDFEKTMNLKLILLGFEQLIGLKIILHKSDFFLFWGSPKRGRPVSELRLWSRPVLS
jgi:hypothetical protein